MAEERLTHAEACEMADDLFRFREDRLTKKEMNFLEDIYESHYPTLTGPMTMWLNNIYDRLMK